MPFHFCADEMIMLLAAIPFLGVFARRLHAWWRTKFPKHVHVCHDHRDEPGPGYTAWRKKRLDAIDNLQAQAYLKDQCDTALAQEMSKELNAASVRQTIVADDEYERVTKIIRSPAEEAGYLTPCGCNQPCLCDFDINDPGYKPVPLTKDWETNPSCSEDLAYIGWLKRQK